MMDTNKKIFILLMVLLANQSRAQNAGKKQFTIAEATNGMGTTLATQTIKNLSWQPGANNLWQTDKKNDQDVWLVTHYHDGGKKVSTVGQGTYPEKVASIPSIRWLDKNDAYFINDKDVISGIFADGKFNWSLMVSLPAVAANITVDKGKSIAYTIDNNLWLWDKTRGNMQVTAEANKNIVCGQSVHRDEFGIDKGIFFSPKGQYLAYYRMDQTMVKDYPIIKWDTVPATVDLIKYPMAGGTSHEVTLCVYNPATGKTVTMQTGTKNKDH